MLDLEYLTEDAEKYRVAARSIFGIGATTVDRSSALVCDRRRLKRLGITAIFCKQQAVLWHGLLFFYPGNCRGGEWRYLQCSTGMMKHWIRVLDILAEQV